MGYKWICNECGEESTSLDEAFEHKCEPTSPFESGQMVYVAARTSGYPYSDGRPLKYDFAPTAFDVRGMSLVLDPSTDLYHLVPTAWLAPVTTTEED